MFKYALLAIIIILTGCATVKPITNTVVSTVLLTPDDNLLEDCKVEPPPNKVMYLGIDIFGREKILSTTLEKMYANVFECNARLKGIRDWKAKAIQINKE